MASRGPESRHEGPVRPERPRLLAALAAREPPAELREVGAGAVLAAQGDPDPCLHVVIRGRLRSTERNAAGHTVAVDTFVAGAVVGDVPLLTAHDRSPTTLEAETDAAVMVVPGAVFRALVREEPALVEECVAANQGRRPRDRLLLAATRLVGLLSGESCTLIETCSEWLQLKAGSVLCREGDVDRAIFLVLSGRLRAVTHDGRVLGEVGRGESLGELAALTGEPRSATVVAIRDCEVVRLAHEPFQRLVEHDPAVMRRLMSLVVKRMRSRESGASAVASGRCIAVLPAHETDACRTFAARLARCLRAIGRTAHLTARDVAGVSTAVTQQVGAGEDATPDPLTAWIDVQEATHRFVVFEAEAAMTPWTARSLRQADVVLVVADATREPTPGPVEMRLLCGDRSGETATQVLVLLHDGSRGLPRGTTRWLADRRVGACHHVRIDHGADLERVARRVAGVATGVVFGGGGARGLAHIGVIRALHEAGIAIDMVGGTSMGAVIGSALAMGYDWRQILELSKEGWLRRRPHKEYTFPFMSLIGTRGLERWARSIYGETDVEDLWLDFFCIACNLTTSGHQVLDTGPLWRAVRASAALPGIFLPVLHDGQVLVDGAVVNNLPGDVARDRGCRSVVVVDVSPETTFRYDLDRFPSAWGYALNLLRPRARRQRIPGLVATLMRLPTVSSAERARRTMAEADLCIKPPVAGFGVLEFEAIDRIVQAGYEEARRMIEQPGWRGS